MDDTREIPPHEGGQVRFAHVVVVILSLMLTLFAWQFSKNQIDARITQRFEAARDTALALIVDRMSQYEDALWAGVAAVDSHGGDISYRQWRTFTRTLRIHEKYPGINGIGVIHFHTRASLDEYLATQRRIRPGFRVYPAHDNRILMPITFIEPRDINAAAVGLDVAHERNRRLAALASRDTGTARITGPITLVQDADSTAGFLFYAPFYRGAPPQDAATRRQRALGAVYAPFVVHKLMEGLLDKDLRQVRFSIRDGDTVIHDEHDPDDPLHDPDPMFTQQVPLSLYGRTWTIDLRTNLEFRARNTYTQPTFILIGGLVIETLILALLVLMARANGRAVRYAARVTRALQRKSAKLATTNSELSARNEELGQFAYIASHDLRTPIRGIGGLTEMIEEDLEGYFASPQANPEVRRNLELIHSRVRRMNQLTQGIMDFGRMDDRAQTCDPLVLRDVLTGLTLDLGLDKDHLRLAGDIVSVDVDTVNLRSVLENLIGNAVKYHDRTRPPRITLLAVSRGDRCHFAVSDNGPGIDPRFHDRIFNVFQTLRSGDAPESTGIGLAIVKKAVARHGGTITLKSAPGAGATFSFDWPGRATVLTGPADRAA